MHQIGVWCIFFSILYNDVIQSEYTSISEGQLRKTLKYLAALQEVDTQLYYLESSKGDLPQIVNKFKEELKQREEELTQIKSGIKNIEKDKRNTEVLVVAAKEKLAKYQNQLYDVTSNKEYDAITQEIEMKKNEIDEGEFHILEIEQEKENLEAKLKENLEEKHHIKDELKSKEKELTNVLKATEDKELNLKHQREKIAMRLDKPILRRYERIRNAKNGIAVVSISRDACGGCYKTIPPQKIVEIEKLTELIQCEVCGRIVIPENKLGKFAI